MLNKLRILNNYEGSAIEYIDNYILPFLPNSKKTIDFTKTIYYYLEDEKNIRYVRRFGSYKLRGTIYHTNVPFTVCDNEPPLWFFMESYENKISPFYDYHINRAFPISFAKTKEESLSFSPLFNYGKKKRENSFSKTGLKHCHILDCSPQHIDSNDLSIDSRMLRFISPINHFHFPSPKKYNMPNAYKNDWGEDPSFISLVQQRIYKKFYNHNERLFIDDYYKRCNIINDKRDFLNQEDFQISFHLKNISKNSPVVINKRQSTPNRITKTNKTITRKKTNKTVIRKNFILSKNYYGHNYAINFYDQDNNLISYNHDSVLNELNERITKLPCWEKYGLYTNSKRLPKFVEDLESVIIYEN